MMNNIQSLSIVVPNRACANNCPFCVSRMVNSDVYPNKMDINDPHYDINVKEYLKRLKHVVNLGCQTVMLTGTSEPQQNKQFLVTFALLHSQMGNQFTNIEMQTTGLFLNDNRYYIRFLRNFVGVNTVALSVNSLDDDVNNAILGHGNAVKDVKLIELCTLLKEYDFNIRICLNLSNEFNYFDRFDVAEMKKMFSKLKTCYYADQLTFRKLYSANANTPQSVWISDNMFSETANMKLKSVLEMYPVIGKTLYGMSIRDCEGISVIYDDDCMGKKPFGDVHKYYILRPNCKLYSSWDNEASLVF